ncbi:MAG: 2-dehydropantoate 2-reductase [Candidatus Aureabacteria bacterium]|nr:2-dehydropantoate 2-reductase [Candidatus Auribacterota bacterium]
MVKTSPNILIVGTGAIGSFYGGKLSQIGLNVSTLSRSDYKVVKKKGIRIKSILGNFHFTPKKAYRFGEDIRENFDYIIVTLKVLPNINIPILLKDLVTKHTSIVLLQNGIDIEKHAYKTFPNNEIISGLAFVCINRFEPGIIEHLDFGRLAFGTYPKGISEKTKNLTDLFLKCGIPCSSANYILKVRWQKLVWNAAFNPISVLAGGATTKEILETKQTSSLVKNIMKEVILIANATGNKLPLSIIQKYIKDTKKMKPYKTSMLLDYESRRPMEVEAILGNAVRLSKKKKVPVPHLETFYNLLTLINKINLQNNKK